VNSCACNPPGKTSGAAGTIALRFTTSGAITPNITFSASVASVTAVAHNRKGSRSRKLSKPAT
jgi:hypothetical protein